MAPAVEPREHTRGGKLSDRSISPVTKRRSPRQRSSPRRERSPGRQRSSSPSRTRSPQRNNTTYRRPLGKDKLRDQAVQPKPDRGRLPMRSSSSQSPSPRMKRTRKAQTERESEKVTSREDGRISREERQKGKEREFSEKKRTSSSPSPSPRTKRLMRVQSDRESEKVTSRGDGRNSRDERKKGSDTEVKEKERSSSSRSPSPRTRRLMRVQTDRDAEKVTSKEDERNSRDERKKGRERENRDQERTSNSRSPSPRRKRLMRAQAEREVEKVKDRERGRNTTKEERDKGRTGEHGNTEDILNERRSMRDRKEGGPARSSRHDRDRSFSPKEHSERIRHGSRSRSPSRMSRAHAREEVSNSRVAEDSRESDIDSISRMKAAEESLEAKEKDKQKPSFELSGKLAEETNRVRGITLLFNEPADARKPDVRWRLYVFKGGEVLNEPLYVHRQSCYLFGRERRVADIPTDHPSCSKQHAVIQYRLVEKEQPDGLMSKQVRPYVMDLGSTNGTFINDNRIEPQRYYELMEKDTIKFGNSSREYVILHENSVN